MEFRTFLYGEVDQKKIGRPSILTADVKLKVVDFWKGNPVISVDRRNNRHAVKITKKKLNPLLIDVPDNNVEVVDTTRGKQLQSQRYTKPFKRMYKEYFGTFCNMKPFYI